MTIPAGILLAAFALIYVPSIGHGFVKDDFGWIARSPLATASDALRLLTGAPSGFFRPLVSLTFGVNRWFCGVEPLCYGFTNFALALGCGSAIVLLARGLALPRGAALAAGALWLFNWHGINMATLWTSGRTALLVVLFAVLAAAAYVRERFVLAVLSCFAAMLAKEEGIFLPAILLAWAVVSRKPRISARLSWFVLGSVAAETAYFVLRARSGAFTPASAPPFYRLSFTLSRFADNLPGYSDRTTTFTAVVVAAALIICRPRLAALRRTDVAIAICGATWWAGSLAVTLFLPVRSSLYACLPSVGSALAGAAVMAAIWPSTPPARQRVAVWAGLALPFVLWPVYNARNGPWVREGDLSAETIRVLRGVAQDRANAVVLLKDDRTDRFSLDSAFGTVLPVAVELMVSPQLTAWIDPPPADAALAGLQQPSHVDVQFALRNGHLVKSP